MDSSASRTSCGCFTGETCRFFHISPEMSEKKTCDSSNQFVGDEKSWGAKWHTASGEFLHGFGFLGIWSRLAFFDLRRGIARILCMKWLQKTQECNCNLFFSPKCLVLLFFNEMFVPSIIVQKSCNSMLSHQTLINARDNDAVGCLRLLARKMLWKIRRGQKQKTGRFFGVRMS